MGNRRCGIGEGIFRRLYILFGKFIKIQLLISPKWYKVIRLTLEDYMDRNIGIL